MELKRYLSVVFKRLWIIIIALIVTGGLSGYISFYILKPVYEAKTSFYVVYRNSDPRYTVGYSELLAGQLLVKDYRELVRSRLITSKVIEELELEHITPQQLAAKTSISSKNDTRFIEIRIQDHNPEMSALIANKMGEVFTAKAVELMKVETIQTIDKAQTPNIPVKPRPLMNIAISVFAGVMAALGIIFLIEYLDNKIRTEEDVEKLLGLQVLGTIPVLNIK